jgi:serine/threonine-protein kinase
MLQKHISEPPAALHAHRTDLPAWCESIVQRAMAKLPAERFQTASEFRTALRRAAGATPRASRAECADGAHAEDTPATARPRKTTMVLSRKAATAIRKSARSATAARRSAVVKSRRPMAFALIGLVASLVLLAPATPPRRTASTRVDRPAGVAPRAALVPPAALASPPALAPPAAAVTAPSEFKRPAKPQAVIARPARKTYPSLAFVTKGLVESGRERQVRDVRLMLAGKSITVTDDATRERLQVVRYDDVSAITYSHGRDPMRNSSDGPTRIVRTAGRFSRVLGISARHHWISLMTSTDRRFVILRVTDSQVGDVLSALEERTGRTPQLLESRKGAD